MKNINKCVIFLTVYNCENYIKQSIESVLNQSYKNFDLVIYNDGSTDNSLNIINNYLEDNRVILINHKENKGIGRVCYELFRDYYDYDYICRLDADDVYCENYLEEQINFLESTDNVVAFADVRYIDENDVFIDKDYYYHHVWLDKFNQKDSVKTLLKCNYLCSSSALISNKKLCLNKFIVGYNNDRLQDHELWLNLSVLGKFGHNENTYIKYRFHNNNLSNPYKRIIQDKLENYNMFQKFIFSDAFWAFLENNNIGSDFLDSICEIFYEKKDYFDNPYLLLLISFCELALERGYYSKNIINKLNSCYLEIGLIQKFMQNNSYKVISYCDFIEVDLEKQKKILDLGIFENQNNNSGVYNLHSINIYQCDCLQEVDAISGPAIIISDSLEEQIYWDVLIVNSNAINRNLIVYYLQDKVFYYQNGVFINTIGDYWEDLFCLNKENEMLKKKLNGIYNTRLWRFRNFAKKIVNFIWGA